MPRWEDELSSRDTKFGQTHLWGCVLLFFAIGDLVTTVIGLRIDGVYERSPIPALLIAVFGSEILIFLKSITLIIFFGVWRVTPGPYNIGIPVGLVLIGVFATMWNIITIVHVLLVA